jgi:hypothetical protein
MRDEPREAVAMPGIFAGGRGGEALGFRRQHGLVIGEGAFADALEPVRGAHLQEAPVGPGRDVDAAERDALDPAHLHAIRLRSTARRAVLHAAPASAVPQPAAGLPPPIPCSSDRAARIIAGTWPRAAAIAWWACASTGSTGPPRPASAASPSQKAAAMSCRAAAARHHATAAASSRGLAWAR